MEDFFFFFYFRQHFIKFISFLIFFLDCFDSCSMEYENMKLKLKVERTPQFYSEA